MGDATAGKERESNTTTTMMMMMWMDNVGGVDVSEGERAIRCERERERERKQDEILEGDIFLVRMIKLKIERVRAVIKG